MTEKPLILLVDDERDILEIYKTGLEEKGFRVTTAENGLTAFDAVKAERPDLILLDLKMPVMNGAEFMIKLNADPKLKDIKVVFLTAFSDPAFPDMDLKYAKELGAKDFIKKGIGLDQFVKMVEEHLRG
ncbi:MAG TPA: response regulator [Candidatus Paceibacterota bacterium]